MKNRNKNTALSKNITNHVHTGLAIVRAYGRNIRNTKNEPEAPFLKYIISPDDICLHIGATDGRHSYMMEKILRKGSGHIYAFEPSIITYPVLKGVIALHGLKHKITPAQLAFSDQSKKLTLNVPIKKSGRRGNAYGFVSEKTQELRPDIESQDMIHFDVEAVTIDHIVSTQAGRVDFIRMDIEGSEKLALKGGWESIKKFKPHLLIEIHPDLLRKQFRTDPQEIYNDFKDLGYEIYHLDTNNKVVPSENFNIAPWKDYFVLHPERPHKLVI
ncbi:MAG: FkbM family methyltransferase [Alphaproteobacteria bacterium]|nr:FkbM family methyltransferase [Alphaproteobacteria bacterium]